MIAAPAELIEELLNASKTESVTRVESTAYTDVSEGASSDQAHIVAVRSRCGTKRYSFRCDRHGPGLR